MPPRKLTTCDCCMEPNVWCTWIMAYDGQGHLYGGWACAKCHVALIKYRKELEANRGESESQERTPGK